MSAPDKLDHELDRELDPRARMALGKLGGSVDFKVGERVRLTYDKLRHEATSWRLSYAQPGALGTVRIASEGIVVDWDFGQTSFFGKRSSEHPGEPSNYVELVAAGELEPEPEPGEL